MMSALKFLVTGGGGFIGSHLVEELVRRKHIVRVLDNFSTGKRQNLAPFLQSIELIEGDVRAYGVVEDAVRDIDIVLHQAALPSVPRSIRDPITSHEVNTVGTLNILEASRKAGVKRVVYASSSSVYGNSPALPKKEDMPEKPLSPYAVSKLAGEKFCSVYSNLHHLETVCLRYFNVFGPRQDPDSQYSGVIAKFTKAISRNEQPTIFGDGSQSRDFTYVTNVVHANLLAASAENVTGEVFNCACATAVTLVDLVAEINRALGKNVQPLFAEERAGDVKHSLADLSRIHDRLGYEVKIPFSEGLRRTIEGLD